MKGMKGGWEEEVPGFNRKCVGKTTEHLTTAGGSADIRTGFCPRTSQMRWLIFEGRKKFWLRLAQCANVRKNILQRCCSVYFIKHF